MEVEFRKSFLKDLKGKDNAVLNQLRILIEKLETSNTLESIKNIKKMKGSEFYYRIKLGDYRLNISRNTLSKVLHGQSTINPDLALRLELVFKKPSAEHWLRLQNAYDLWQAREHQAELQVRPYPACV